jgi:glycosyltransferase involved in cell wall biosynthesis
MVLERFGYSQDNLGVILNGVDTILFNPSPISDAKTVLYAGGDAKTKGFAHFIRAASNISRCDNNVRFVMTGVRNRNTRVPCFIENSGRISHEDMPKYYKKASCTCMPSLHPEGLALVALESMACARPVVAYASGGNIETVKHGETGFLVEPGDVKELSEMTLWLLNNLESAREMGLKSRKLVEEKFSLDVMTYQYERIYHEIASR